MSFSSKVFTILAILSVTLVYALYEKSKYDHLETQRELILKSLPEFKAKLLKSGEMINQSDVLNRSDKAVMIHFWGTWCGPCEAELPSFVKFARRLEPLGVNFLLLAVNDKEKKVRRFMKRFDKLPPNVRVALDQTGDILNRFGTVKVPETYLFSGQGEHLNKFVGPQDWEMPTYFDRVNRLLQNTLKGRSQEVETH